jgi:hypothetical protein
MRHTIYKGFHFTFPPNVGVHFGKQFGTYKIKFDGSCRYKQLDEENDWNKLVGWSYGYHKENSIRLAWRYKEDIDRIELVPYFYANGVRIVLENNIITVLLEMELTLMIQVGPRVRSSFSGVERFLYLAVNNETLNMKITPGYTLGPYFGGNGAAPHTMHIDVKKL